MKKLVNLIKAAKEKIRSMASKVSGIVAGSAAVSALALSTFAATGENVAVTTEMLEPVLQGAKDNIGVILPIGIGLFAILLGISFIPMILKKFKKG